MPYLARGTKLGFAKESAFGTWLAPTVSVPWNPGTASFEDVIPQLRDESVRANDNVLQGVSQGGPWTTTWAFECNGYSDILGHFLVAMGLFDTVTAGVSTTLSAGTAAGATSITTAASIPAASTIKITSAAGTDYAVTGTPSGAGPYTIPLTSPAGGLLYAHLTADPVVSQTRHAFAQNRTFTTVWPSYAFTTDDGATQQGWPGCVASELALKIDPKGFITASPKYTGMPSLAEATFSYAASAVQPLLGWAWTLTNGGTSRTTGLTMDFSLKRSVDPIAASTGAQAPRNIFAGALEADGTYKAIFETTAELNLYLQALQSPTVHALAQPLAAGGASLVLTMSKSSYLTGKRDMGQPYVQADFTLAGIANTTDAGAVAATLSNFSAAQY